jgi:uncharacterized membrane protein YkvA (DUF1232 family)
MNEAWKKWARSLKTNTYALYLASRDPRVPWLAKVIVALVVAYALSPIDLIPDFIPVIGYLDDLLLLPIGIWLAIRMIPEAAWKECKLSAHQAVIELPKNWRAGAVIIFIWFLLIGAFLFWVWPLLSGKEST